MAASKAEFLPSQPLSEPSESDDPGRAVGAGGGAGESASPGEPALQRQGDTEPGVPTQKNGGAAAAAAAGGRGAGPVPFTFRPEICPKSRRYWSRKIG